jgi:uncharacterized membrane-anchored protein YitT (DUF2179 family)
MKVSERPTGEIILFTVVLFIFFPHFMFALLGIAIASAILYGIAKGIYDQQYQLWTGRDPNEKHERTLAEKANKEEQIKLAKY